MALTTYYFVIIVCFGLIFGSFFNVVIYRLPRGQSIVRPRSFCPSCETMIRWYDNIPILSYILLNGKCRACSKSIALVYPFVELLSGLLFAGVYILDGVTGILPFHLFFGSAMLVLAFIDWEHRILPNAITLPGIAIGFGSSFLNAQLPWWDSLLSIFLFSSALLGVGAAFKALRGVEGIGMGDVKMIGLIGGFLGVKLTVLTILLASTLGLLFGLAIVGFRRGDFQYKIPFGTFLALAAVVALFFGTPIVEWYKHLFWTPVVI